MSPVAVYSNKIDYQPDGEKKEAFIRASHVHIQIRASEIGHYSGEKHVLHCCYIIYDVLF